MRNPLTNGTGVSSPGKVDSNLIYPLNEFYERLGLRLPAVTRVDGQQMPEPYKTLLVHNRDMTPTLESAHDRSILLRVLGSTLSGDVLSREVLLIPEGAEAPVAFGASKIHLEYFPDEATPELLEGKRPLGAILRAHGITHTGRPEIFLEVTADDLIHRALGLAAPARLYGRRNALFDAAGRTLAEVVEILPPANGNLHTKRNRANSQSL